MARDIVIALSSKAAASAGQWPPAVVTGKPLVVHAVPEPGSNGISACCNRAPCEFVGERVTRDPNEVTCPGPAAVSPPGKERRRCAHSDIVYGRCVRFIDDHDGECVHENQPDGEA
ncbi:hypothetical protein [Streptomyces sp. Midd1]|uniref:hypothetical protein n=1 Tax=Streptomyces sp. Midd3 TaxID=3161191 RepID=UPI0034DB0B37